MQASIPGTFGGNRGILSKIVQFGKVVNSALSSKTGAIMFDVVSLADDEDVTEANSTTRDNQEAYSSLGILARPRKQSADDKKKDLFAESLALTVSDGLIPFAYRDQRILDWVNKGGGTAPKEGQIMFAGYGGAFLSYETIDQTNGPANIVVLYVPYSRNSSGVPQKAHVITLDPSAGNESIGIGHAEGLAMTMSASEGILFRADSSTWFALKPGPGGTGQFTMNASKIALQGNVVVGANVAAAVPLLAGPASPPSTSFFVSP